MAHKTSLFIITALVAVKGVYASSTLELTPEHLKSACHSPNRYVDVKGHRIYAISNTPMKVDFSKPVLKGIGIHPDLGTNGIMHKYKVDNSFIETLSIPLSDINHLPPAILSLITPELASNTKQKRGSFMESIRNSISSFRKSFLSFMKSSPSIKTPTEDLKEKLTPKERDVLPIVTIIEEESQKARNLDALPHALLGQKDIALKPRKASRNSKKLEPMIFKTSIKNNQYPIQTVTSLPDNIKVIMMPGGLPIQDSFLYKNIRQMLIPNVPLINYYNPDFPLMTPLIISGQVSDEKYIQVVLQSRPTGDITQTNGLLLRPHFAMHNSNKSPNYQVNLEDYNDKSANKLILNGQYNVSTHDGEGGSIASPDNMPTGIGINTQSSLNRSTIIGWNDYLNKDITLTTYHIILESVFPTYSILDQINMTNFNMDILLQELKYVTTDAGSSQESADRFFNDMIVDLKNNKKQ